MSVLKGPKTATSLPHVIAPADMVKLLSVYREGKDPSSLRNQALLEFLYACGARISEASGLELRNVDFNAKQVKVRGKGDKERIIPLHDLAIGAMREYARHGRPELLKDKDGEIVVSRLDEKVLQEVAEAGKGLYVRAGNSEFGLNPVIDEIKRMDDEKYNSIVFEEFDEQFMYFLGIALFFFVVEMLVGDRRPRRHLFKREVDENTYIYIDIAYAFCCGFRLWTGG